MPYTGYKQTKKHIAKRKKGKKYRCKRCGYVWESRLNRKPRSCPYCKNPKWSKKRAKSGRKKRR